MILMKVLFNPGQTEKPIWHGQEQHPVLLSMPDRLCYTMFFLRYDKIQDVSAHAVHAVCYSHTDKQLIIILIILDAYK